MAYKIYLRVKSLLIPVLQIIGDCFYFRQYPRRRSETIASRACATQFLADRYSALKFARGEIVAAARCFAEIRRALPSSYRESRKAVSTVVFGPAVSLERSTPLMRPRHDSHAENKNISPPLARSEFLVPVNGDPACRGPVSAKYLRWTGFRMVFCLGSHVDHCALAERSPARRRARRENSRLQQCAKPPLNNAPEKLAVKV